MASKKDAIPKELALYLKSFYQASQSFSYTAIFEPVSYFCLSINYYLHILTFFRPKLKLLISRLSSLLPAFPDLIKNRNTF
jgi:hypothetical protein